VLLAHPTVSDAPRLQPRTEPERRKRQAAATIGGTVALHGHPSILLRAYGRTRPGWHGAVDKAFRPATTIYSIGMVYYEMLLAACPFDQSAPQLFAHAGPLIEADGVVERWQKSAVLGGAPAGRIVGLGSRCPQGWQRTRGKQIQRASTGRVDLHRLLEDDRCARPPEMRLAARVSRTGAPPRRHPRLTALALARPPRRLLLHRRQNILHGTRAQRAPAEEQVLRGRRRQAHVQRAVREGTRKAMLPGFTPRRHAAVPSTGGGNECEKTLGLY